LSVENIVAEIDSEIAHLEQAKALLSDKPATKKRPGRPRLNAVMAFAPVKLKRRKMSAAARAKIAAAQKALWARAKTAKGSPVARSEGSK